MNVITGQISNQSVVKIMSKGLTAVDWEMNSKHLVGLKASKLNVSLVPQSDETRIGTVSYTHLDVYKRQIYLFNSARPKFDS